MAGYVRQSSADIIATAVVRANPLNVEYNALRDAFNASTGHKHDGTAAEGAYVPLIADSDALNKVVIDTSNNRVGVFVEVASAAVEQIRIQDGAVVPVTNNDIDLGTSSLQFKDLFIDGTATVDALQVDANAVVTGNLTVNGNATLGNAASDTVTVTADVASPLLPSADDTYDLGAVGSEWRNLYIDGIANIDALVADTADINGGTVDGAVIGGASAAAGTFTSLNASGTSTLTTVDINGGNIDGTIIGAGSAAAITGTTITGTSLVGPVTGDVTGNADTATALETARTIGGVSFNGTANINLPGVNTSGNQDTSGNAATATALETARTIGGVSFNGTSDINLAGVNTTGNQDTSGNAASATVLQTARTIAGNSFNGSANITIAATDLSDTDQSLATSDNVQFAQVTTTGNAIIGGNLTVNGTTTTINSSNMTVDDQLIELGNGRSGSASGDAGIVIERGDDANAFIGFDESADKFTVGTGTFTGASTGDLTITTGTLVANIEGNVTGAVTGNADTATALETARTIAGQSFDGTANITIAPTDLTGVNATATELNIMDGDTSATSTTLADADRVVVNDDGTMKQVALTDFETYFETSLDTLSNVTEVGALNSGSITSGFGAIDVGSSAITTTGTINFGSLADGSITATGFVDEDNMSSNSATLIPTQQSVKAYVDTVAGTSNNVTGLTATGAELNTVADFSDVSVDTSTAIASNDALLVFDNGNEIGYRDVDLLDTYFSGTTKTLTNKTLTSPVVTGMHLNDSGFTVEGSGADGNETTVAFTNPTTDRTITFPDATGNVPVFTAAPSAAIADGSSGQFLTTNGSGVLSFATVDAGGASLQTTEALVNGDLVSLNSTGTVSKVDAGGTLSSGTANQLSQYGPNGQITAYNTVATDGNGTFVTFYAGQQTFNTAPNLGPYVVAHTVNGTTVTSGTPLLLRNAEVIPYTNVTIIYDSAQQKFLAIAPFSDYSQAFLISVSGTTCTLESTTNLPSKGLRWAGDYDASAGKGVFLYQLSPNNNVFVIASTISGTSVSFNTPTAVLTTSNAIECTSVAYNSTAQKSVVVYNGNYGNLYANVVGLSGTTFTIGSQVTVHAGAPGGGFTVGLFPIHGQSSVGINYASSVSPLIPKARIGSISGTTLTLGTEVTLGTARSDDNWGFYQSGSGKIIFGYGTSNTNFYRSATVSGTTITLGTEVTFAPLPQASYSSKRQSVSRNNSGPVLMLTKAYGQSRIYAVALSVSTSNADNFIGISGETIAANATGKINTLSDINTGQSSLTIGSKYYLQADGTLGTTVVADKEVGIALSATDLLITYDPTASANYTNSNVDTHLNTSTAASGEFLSWNGSDYDWAAAGADLYAANPVSATDPTASGDNAISIGNASVASGDQAVAIGAQGATASATDSIAIGYSADATATKAIAIGRNAQATGSFATAIGGSTYGGGSTAIGAGATALGGSYASGTDSFAAAIPNNTSSYGATGTSSIAIGGLSRATSHSSVAIGYDAVSTGIGSVALGRNCNATDHYATAIGSGNSASQNQAAAVFGENNTASANNALAIGGGNNTASGTNSIAMGSSSTASHTNSIALGTSVQSTATYQINLGGTADTVRISETYTLPTSDGSANQVLTTNGSGAVTFADAGGGADLYAANESSPSGQPSATGGNAVAIGDTATASGNDAIAIGENSTASGSKAIALGNGNTASATYAFAAGSNSSNATADSAVGINGKAGGTLSVAIGTGGNSMLNDASVTAGTQGGAMALAGAYASGRGAVGIGNQDSNGSYGALGYASVAIGYNAKSANSSDYAFGSLTVASGGYSTALGGGCSATGSNSVSIGKNNTASGSYSTTAGGQYSTASGSYSYSSGHYSTASGTYSYASGLQSVSAIYGKNTYASGRFAANGDAQGSIFILRADTTDATATVLTTNNSTASTDNQIIAASDTCITFDGTITAMQNGAQAYASWKIEGLLVNDGGTTTLANSATTVISNGSSWGMALSADNTNNALAITCTGEASHNIRWVANIRTTEVTYA